MIDIPKTAHVIGLAWYRAEDYQRIREISHDEMQPTFADFEAKMARDLPKIRAELPANIVIEKVIVDPDALLKFARRFHAGQIDTKVRSAFAAWSVSEKYAGT